MNKQQAIMFLFTIAKEIKRSFESPVILVTIKDYAESIFNSLVDMRTALLQRSAPDGVLDIISNFHLQWLQAVQDIERYKKRIKSIPRETIYKAIEYTKDCVKNRSKCFRMYIEKLNTIMSEDEKLLMSQDLDVIGDMHDSLNSVLRDKQKCLSNLADQTEFCAKLSDEIEELMNWLDELNDHLAIEFSIAVGIRFPQFLTDLAMTLNEIIDKVATSPDAETQKIVKELTEKRQILGKMGRLNVSDELEMRNLLEKITTLENRIARLKSENSSAVMALQHKTIYLEERLQSLENLKVSLFTLKNKQKQESQTSNQNQQQEHYCHIFDHLLPAQDRRRLVGQLVKLWDNAIHGIQDGKSIISILSVADIKETFSDELGKFTVDKHGRKLYKADDDDHWYQLNERNELVAIEDDDRLVYFYDDCGRYYLNNDMQRVYKAHANASEYMINHEGVMLKFKEASQSHGVDYWYDELGRYYEDHGKKIYCDKNCDDKYENDGLGNLVRMRSEQVIYEPCPLQPVVTEESKYLQRTVGVALKKCLAEVVLQQPVDPILYLANSLEKYRFNIQIRQQRLQDEMEMMAERQRFMDLEGTAAHSYDTGGEECSSLTTDYNFINYQSTTPKSF